MGIATKGSVTDPTGLPTVANPGDVYYVQSNGHLYVYGQGGWSDMGLAAGPPGPPGPQGIQGSTGAQGPAGTAGQNQTPWLGDENAASHYLNNVSGIGVNTAAVQNGPGITADMTGANNYGMLTQSTGLTDFTGFGVRYIAMGGATAQFLVYASSYAADATRAGNTQINGVNDLFFTVSPTGGSQVEVARFKVGNGYFGLGTKTPTHLLELAADSAAKPSTSTWQITSDARTKQHAHPLEGGLSVINVIEPIEAEYNGAAGTAAGARVVSVDPAKVREVLPHAVTSRRAKLSPDDEEETDVLHFNVHEVLFHLILAVQQLSRQLVAARS